MQGLRLGLLLGLLGPAFAAESPRPRGVGPEFAKYYKSKDTFTCISNPSIVIPFSKVNDDHCDCPDGSDEPGTPACSFLSAKSPWNIVNTRGLKNANTTKVLPGFYCKNKGHRPSYVAFENVNDGVCDYEVCCDGSEEYGDVRGTPCPDKCKEIGIEWRKNDEIRQKSMGAAGQKRKELVLQAQRLRKEIEDRIKTIETQLEGAQVKITQAEEELAKVEAKEKSKLARSSGSAGKLGILVNLARDRVDELRESLAIVKLQRDAQKEKVSTLESILRTFKEEYNPNFNDEGVKRAVRAWEDYAAGGAETTEGGEELEQDLQEILKADTAENGINWAEYEAVSEDAVPDEVELLYSFSAYLPPQVRTFIDAKYAAIRQWLVDNSFLPASTPADPNSAAPESTAMKNAREAVSSARSSYDGLVRSKSEHETDLSKSFGPDDIFRAMKDQCVSGDSGEYTYEVCWLGAAAQKSRKNGQSTSLGRYNRFETVLVDADDHEIETLGGKVSPDGKIARIAMKFQDGAHCWNGPSRSVTVTLKCSEKDEVYRTYEEEKCVYRMDVGTAAVCGVDAETWDKVPGTEGQQKEEVKDEL